MTSPKKQAAPIPAVFPLFSRCFPAVRAKFPLFSRCFPAVLASFPPFFFFSFFPHPNENLDFCSFWPLFPENLHHQGVYEVWARSERESKDFRVSFVCCRFGSVPSGHLRILEFRLDVVGQTNGALP